MRHLLATLLLFACLFCGCTPSSDKPEDLYFGEGGKTTEVKVITYNIRLSTGNDGDNSWQYRKQASVNMIRAEKPTLIGFQEMLSDQVNYLLESLPEYKMIGVGRDDGAKAGEFMSIFYRTDKVELLEWDTFWLSPTPDVPSKGWDASYKRTCTWATFRSLATGTTFAHFNTHLDHQGVVAQKEGLKLVVEKIGELVPADMPVFLTGDFNIPTDNEAFAMLDGVLLDARKTSPETDQRATYNAWGGREATIDHIFYRKTTPYVFKVLRNENYGAPYISDHYPVSLVATIK
ncbi:MAG: endonuclease/exonuclease/phosphatase family protein [Tidjanibacter sp.]|nr:endonuclease/exonuclease/phosphatase family protein [Tidjanibacter sp.]